MGISTGPRPVLSSQKRGDAASMSPLQHRCGFDATPQASWILARSVVCFKRRTDTGCWLDAGENPVLIPYAKIFVG